MKPYYERDGITIYHGDCREIVPDLEGVADAAITDPPYGISLESQGQHFRAAEKITCDESLEVGQGLVDWCLRQYLCTVAFCSPWMPWRGEWRNWLVWDKGEHVGIGGDRATCWKRSWELIGVAHNPPLNGVRDGAVLRFNAVSPPPTGHVAEKPEKLMRYLVGKVTAPGALVLDPFMGSGTTLRAAKDLGRRAIGIEIEERYCEIAAKRLAQGVLL